MGKRPAVDLQALSVEFQYTKENQAEAESIQRTAMLYIRAFQELKKDEMRERKRGRPRGEKR